MSSQHVASNELNYFGDAKVAALPITDTSKDTEDVEGVEGSDTEASAELSPNFSMETPKDVQDFRKHHRIRVYGNDVPNPISSFSDLYDRFKVKKYLRTNISTAKFTEPSPIQMQAMTISLHGREVMACAPTGSGKTLAFVVPILHDLKGPTKEGFRAVVISPTRELAQQTYRQFETMSKGKPFKICVLTQVANIENPKVTEQFNHFGEIGLFFSTVSFAHSKYLLDILIATPLRLVHALKHDALKLDLVRHLVLDEADQLLDLGFLDQIDEILAACTSPKITRSLYSATIPSSVEELATSIMKDPIRVVIGQK
jgi:ATP-dependent RNA helicase DDX52/ROK1